MNIILRWLGLEKELQTLEQKIREHEHDFEVDIPVLDHRDELNSLKEEIDLLNERLDSVLSWHNGVEPIIIKHHVDTINEDPKAKPKWIKNQ